MWTAFVLILLALFVVETFLVITMYQDMKGYLYWQNRGQDQWRRWFWCLHEIELEVYLRDKEIVSEPQMIRDQHLHASFFYGGKVYSVTCYGPSIWVLRFSDHGKHWTQHEESVHLLDPLLVKLEGVNLHGES